MKRLNIPLNISLFRKAILCFSCFISIISSAQTAHTFMYDCVIPGQNMVIDAQVANTSPVTNYHWQYKIPTGSWTCFTNGSNNINGVNFMVSGATGTGVNDAPALTIYAATIALEGVIVRVAMANNADPCSTPAPPQVWNADDQAPEQTKYLKLHVYSNSLSCPPFAYSCPGNVLVNSGKFYGGFENISFNAAAETYDRKNFNSTAASSDLYFGTGPGHFQDINNPFAMNPSFARNIAPHSGDYQMVIEGSSVNSDKVWSKTINVINGKQYAFTAWITRVDNTDPVVELYVNNTIIGSSDMSNIAIGEWKMLQGTFTAFNSFPLNFNIRDGRLGGLNNFSLDDICLRECNNCSILELHHLNLTASLIKEEVRIKWTAENEMGTAKFVVERSFDAVNFQKIGEKLPSGPVNTPTAYYFNDNIQGVGATNNIYYRIKAMDSNGRYAYSNVAIINLGKSSTVELWPVPFNDFFNITYNSAGNSKIEVRLTSADGKIIRQTSYAVMRGLNQISLNDLGGLASNIYFVRITDLNTNQVYNRKLSK